MQKRVMTIQDISCQGRCSLTVALPILSACGIETAILPTAVLSTHTGGFTGFTFRDLTDDITPISDHWKTLDRHYDAIYTGFMGSAHQIDLVQQMFRDFKDQGTVIMVDPAMADNGVLYKTYTKEMVEGTIGLAKMSDIVIPNQTEAAYLLGEEYKGDVKTPEEAEALMKKLAALGPKYVVVTGISFEEGKLGAGSYDSTTGKISYAFQDRAPGYFHGTGDVFASAFLGAYLQAKPGEDPLAKGVQVAVDYTCDCIHRTIAEKQDIKYGVAFEMEVPKLLEYIK